MASYRITPAHAAAVPAAISPTRPRSIRTPSAPPPGLAAEERGLKHAALYARVSTEKQEREDTVASQVDLLYQAATAWSRTQCLRIMFRDLSRLVCIVPISRLSALETYFQPLVPAS